MRTGRVAGAGVDGAVASRGVAAVVADGAGPIAAGEGCVATVELATTAGPDANTANAISTTLVTSNLQKDPIDDTRCFLPA